MLINDCDCARVRGALSHRMPRTGRWSQKSDFLKTLEKVEFLTTRNLRESCSALQPSILYHFKMCITSHLKYLADIRTAQYSVPLRMQGGVPVPWPSNP